MLVTSATRPRLVNAADTVLPFAHQRHTRFVFAAAWDRRSSALRVIPSRTRPMLRGPTGERRAQAAARRPPDGPAPRPTLSATRRT